MLMDFPSRAASFRGALIPLLRSRFRWIAGEILQEKGRPGLVPLRLHPP